MTTLPQQFPDLRFAPENLYFSDEEYNSIAKEFFGNSGPDTLTNRDRAFLQAALFVAVDKSEKAGALFGIWTSFVTATPSQSLVKLAKKLAQTGAKYLYAAYIDDDPKYSAVGRAGVQYSAFTTEWRVRVGTGDTSMLSNFLKFGT